MNNVRYKCLLPQGVVQFNTISLVLWGGGLTRVLSTLVKTMSVQHGNQLSAFKMLNQTTPQGNVAPMFMLIVIGWSITPHKNMYFSYTFSFWSNLLKPVSDEINCYSSAHLQSIYYLHVVEDSSSNTQLWHPQMQIHMLYIDHQCQV